MKKQRAICAVLALLLLAGCQAKPVETPSASVDTAPSSASSAPAPDAALSAEPDDSAAPQADTLTFTDDLGREVTTPMHPQRVAALLGSFADIWLLAGGEVCATADDAWEDLQLDLPESAVNIGNLQGRSLEKLLSAQPDFILASANTRQDLEWQDTLEKAGIPTAYFDVPDFSSYLRLLELCTQLTGQPERYEEYGTKVAEQLETIRAEGKKKAEENGAPRVLVLRASPSIIQAKNSTGNVLGELLADLGCENIADADGTLLETLSLEHILQADPEYIFVVQRGSDVEGTRAAVDAMLADQPAWKEITAVQNGHVFYMDKTLFSLKPNARWAEAYKVAEGLLWDET